MAKVSDVEDGQDELDVGIVAHTICERQTTGVAATALVARAEAAVEHSMRYGRAILWLVQVTLVGLELGDGDDFLRREDRELNVLAVKSARRVSESVLTQTELPGPCCCSLTAYRTPSHALRSANNNGRTACTSRAVAQATRQAPAVVYIDCTGIPLYRTPPARPPSKSEQHANAAQHSAASSRSRSTTSA